MKRAFLLALSMALAACGAGSDDADPPAGNAQGAGESLNPIESRVSAAKVVVDANGLSAGQAKDRQQARFGSPRGEVDALLAKAFGAEPEQTTNNECGAGKTDFSQSGPLQAAFQDGRFTGWYLGEGDGVVTSDGIAPGASMAALRNERPVQIITNSTLTGEFQYQAADGGMITGFFEGSETAGRITGLAAGMTCFFR